MRMKPGALLAVIVGLALCFMLLWPLTAIAAQPAEMPETAQLVEAPFAPEGDYGTITIRNEGNGRFSFDVPAITWVDSYGAEHTVTGFHVTGSAHVSDGKDRIDNNYSDSYISVPEGDYYGDLDAGGTQITYTEIYEYDGVTRTKTRNMTPERGHFFSGPLDDGETYFLFFMPYRAIETQTFTYPAAPTEYSEAQTHNQEGFRFRLDAPGFSPVPAAGAAAPSDGAAGQTEGAGPGGHSSADPGHAAPLTTILISILAILFATLFGSAGGFVPPVPVGAGGPAAGGGGAPADSLNRWVRVDEDGDLEATDPVSGQKRTFVHNGDGTYTDPVTGATYTPEELSAQMEHRAENAGTIRRDEQQSKEHVAEDAARNRERASHSLDTEKELQEKRAQDEQDRKRRLMAEKLGIKSDAGREHIQQAYEHERDSELADSEYEAERANELDESIDTLEKYETAADYAVNAGEVLPGGKAVSATYKGVKNLGATVAEKGLNTGAVIEGVIKGGTEAATTLMDAGLGKAGVTIGGTVAGEVAEAVNDGEDIGDAIKDGLITGAGNAAVGAVGDAVGGVVEGEGVLNKAAEAAEKVAETAYGKEIVEPNLKERVEKK